MLPQWAAVLAVADAVTATSKLGLVATCTWSVIFGSFMFFPLFQAAVMLGRQSMLWVIGAGDVRSPVPAIATGLGISKEEAGGLVERMPVLLACEQSWLKLK